MHHLKPIQAEENKNKNERIREIIILMIGLFSLKMASNDNRMLIRQSLIYEFKTFTLMDSLFLSPFYSYCCLLFFYSFIFYLKGFFGDFSITLKFYNLIVIVNEQKKTEK